LIGSFFLPESPKFLYEKKRYEDAKNSLRIMAKFNGVKVQNYIFDREEIDIKKSGSRDVS